jgi:TRAP-type C4-dicarboxylate transport system substrate-binding protein
VNFKVYEVCKDVALTNHIYNAGILMVSKARWTQMTPADQTAFREAGRAIRGYWRDTITKASDSAADTLKQRGMQINAVDFKPFQEKMTSVYTEFKPKYPKLLDDILAQQS